MPLWPTGVTTHSVSHLAVCRPQTSHSAGFNVVADQCILNDNVYVLYCIQITTIFSENNVFLMLFIGDLIAHILHRGCSQQ